MFISVVLPAPFSPSKRDDFAAKLDEIMASLATNAPKRLVIPASRKTISGARAAGSDTAITLNETA